MSYLAQFLKRWRRFDGGHGRSLLLLELGMNLVNYKKLYAYVRHQTNNAYAEHAKHTSKQGPPTAYTRIYLHWNAVLQAVMRVVEGSNPKVCLQSETKAWLAGGRGDAPQPIARWRTDGVEPSYIGYRGEPDPRPWSPWYTPSM